jgi:putative transposase
VEEAISSSTATTREPGWTESIAVGSKSFVDGIREQLQLRLTGRKVNDSGSHYELREQETTYSTLFATGNACLNTENMYFMGINDEESV